jgi:hypothetical protein
MPDSGTVPERGEAPAHPRWTRTRESDGFFIDEDGLRGAFHVLLVAGVCLLALLAAGLWRLQAAALKPPLFVGISDGWIFSGPAGTPADLREDDFDRQLRDTVEVLLGRTEKGLPPEVGDFCLPAVIAEVNRAYEDTGRRYPAGYAQDFEVLESKRVSGGPGRREEYYRGLLSSRSATSAQTSPVYLDCVFEVRGRTPLNATGWRLAGIFALAREDYYRAERERSARKALDLPPLPFP